MTSILKGSILDAAGVLDPPTPTERRVDQSRYVKQSFLSVTHRKQINNMR